jgi:transposase
VALDPRDELIAEQAALIARQAATIEAQGKEIASLKLLVAELREKVRKSSRNSSKPPSSDGPAAPPKPKKPPSGRKPGGQPGHEGRGREPLPSGNARKIVACIPDQCERCDMPLHGRDTDPRRHQVFHLPKIEPSFDEYQVHALGCTCGHVTHGKLPLGVPAGAFGPSIVAVLAVLMGVYRLSKRMVPDLMLDLFGLHMSVGAVVGCQHIASHALEAPVEEAAAHVAEQPVKNADETSWREGPTRSRVWLWAVVTHLVVLFKIQARRNADAAREILGGAAGVLVSDRHGAYGWWPDKMRQFCWAHLKRDAQAIADRGGESQLIGNKLLEEIDRMFGWWHRVRDGDLARSTFQAYMRSLRSRVEGTLQSGILCEHPKTAKTCANLLKHSDSLWTFVRIPGVEPTNNAAEQAVRHPVIMRKISYGTHSEAGSRFIERILTVHATLRRQKRCILAFLHDACVAALHGRPSPSLLPMPAPPCQLAKAA